MSTNRYSNSAGQLLQWARLRPDIYQALENEFLLNDEMSPTAVADTLAGAQDLAEELRQIADTIEREAGYLQNELDRLSDRIGV